MTFSYILYACLNIYNKLYTEPSRTDVVYHDAFVYEEAVANMIGTVYTGDIQMTYDTLGFQSAADLFWFKTGMSHGCRI